VRARETNRTRAYLDLREQREQAADCRRCELWRNATQTVFGEGPVPAELMLVGEQPGDAEDLAGRPFVGPAGRILDQALEFAGLDREQVYVTNTVKHFKFEERHKRRIHQKPDAGEIAACNHWLEAELADVAPTVLIALGATAARALIGARFRVTRQHGEFVPSELAPFVTATLHPAAILRMRTPSERTAAQRGFERDIARAAAMLR